MAQMEGVDEFKEFAQSMRNISGEGKGDGIQKAKRDALRDTVDDFKDILKEQIMATETSDGGTLYSKTSPYDPGGTNDTSSDNFHMRNKNAWNSEIVGNDTAAIYPNPEIRDRVRFLEEGTADHGPSGDVPMYFEVGNKLIVVSERTDSERGFMDRQVSKDTFNRRMGNANIDGPVDGEKFETRQEVTPGEVSGVEPQGFIKRAVMVADQTNIYKNNLEKRIDELFQEEASQWM